MAGRFAGAFKHILKLNVQCLAVRSNVNRHFSRSAFLNDGKFLSYQIKDNIAVIKFDQADSKVNTLSRGTITEFEKVFSEIQRNVQGIVVMSGKHDSFIAGADIGMISSCKTKEEVTELSKTGQRLFNMVEECETPVVAAINGTCLGGGLEAALACHYRIAVNSKKTQLGVPEVMLGLLPGAGGSQRLPKLLAVTDALDLMLTGKTVNAKKAKRLGLVDSVMEPIGVGIKTAEENTMDALEKAAILVAKLVYCYNIKDWDRGFCSVIINLNLAQFFTT